MGKPFQHCRCITVKEPMSRWAGKGAGSPEAGLQGGAWPLDGAGPQSRGRGGPKAAAAAVELSTAARSVLSRTTSPGQWQLRLHVSTAASRRLRGRVGALLGRGGRVPGEPRPEATPVQPGSGHAGDWGRGTGALGSQGCGIPAIWNVLWHQPSPLPVSPGASPDHPSPAPGGPPSDLVACLGGAWGCQRMRCASRAGWAASANPAPVASIGSLGDWGGQLQINTL